MRNITVYLFLFLVSVAHAQTSMSSTEAHALKTKVKERAAITKTISSDFIQYKHLDFLNNDIETSGKLIFKTPDLVKWEYMKPFKYSVLFKDDKLYINDEGKKSDINIGSNRLFKQLNTLIINSVKGDMFNAAEFSIEYFKKDNYSLVYFSPKDKKFSKYIKAFHITFNSEGDVIEVKMIESSEDYTKIVFSNKFLNKPLEDALFTP